jgi:transcriptional regulator with XRE-family HTH domain
VNEYDKLCSNLLRSGRYKTYTQIADKLGVTDRSLRRYRQGTRDNPGNLKKLKNIWAGIKRTPYLYVWIAVQKGSMYLFGKCVLSPTKHSYKEYESFMADGIELVAWDRYHQGTKSRITNQIIDKWLELATDYDDEFINLSEFAVQLNAFRRDD